MPNLGERYGLWVVTAGIPSKTGAVYKFLCTCDCGTTRIVNKDALLRGRSRSCGCRSRKVPGAQSYTREYHIWESMKSRCSNANNPAYPYYGGRGITVCDRWHTFSHFRDDMGPRPTLDHEADRIDPNGNYDPTNCRWATRKEQQNNMRNTVFLECDGVRRTLQDWSTVSGVNPKTIYTRIRRGWQAKRAIFHGANGEIVRR